MPRPPRQPAPRPRPGFVTADRLHSAAIRLLRTLRVEDRASGLSAPRLSALSVLDAANDTRHKLNASRGIHLPVLAPPKKSGIGAGGVIAIIFGVAAALGVLYAAWQTLRADDELWVADDPLRAPDA